MKVKVEGMDITISFSDVLSELSLDQKRDLAERLVWDQDIFTDFVEALATNRVITETFNYYIHQARLRLLELLPEMHRNLVRTLLWEKETAQQDKRQADSWAWALYHAWPDAYLGKRPRIPEHKLTPMPTDEAVNQELRSRLHETS